MASPRQQQQDALSSSGAAAATARHQHHLPRPLAPSHRLARGDDVLDGSGGDQQQRVQQRQQRQQPKQQQRSGWDSAKMFAAGGVAGAVARTLTAPLDRIKLLFQVQAVAGSGAAPGAYTGIRQAARKILKEEGARAFWKGNGVNVVRVFPYSAAQLAANDLYKRALADAATGELPVGRRLLAGALAGMTATALTHPLDVVRLRLALPGHAYGGAADAVRRIVAAEGAAALYKGLAPTLLGIAPYAAINFAAYDLLKKRLFGGERPQNPAASLLVGAASGLLAATACYPLDTVRRRMQMAGRAYAGQRQALAAIWAAEGARGLYAGWGANAMKVVPQNAARLAAYEALKALLGVARAATDT